MFLLNNDNMEIERKEKKICSLCVVLCCSSLFYSLFIIFLVFYIFLIFNDFSFTSIILLLFIFWFLLSFLVFCVEKKYLQKTPINIFEPTEKLSKFKHRALKFVEQFNNNKNSIFSLIYIMCLR